MTRRTERVLSLSLLSLILVVGVTALVQLHFNRLVYTDQRGKLQFALKGAVEEACHDPRQAALDKLILCEEAVAGLQADKGLLEASLGELDSEARAARAQVQLELEEAAGRQRNVLDSLTRVEAGVTGVSGDTGRLLDAAAEQRTAVAELLGGLRLPECLENGDSPCHPPTLGLLALAIDADLEQLQNEMKQELEGDDGFAKHLFRELEAQKKSREQQSQTWIQTVEAYEEQLKEIREVIAERDRLRQVLAGGVTPNPEVSRLGKGSFAVTIEPPIDGYRCSDLQLVAKLVDVVIGAKLCQRLAGIDYQCGRLGGQHNSLTLWATYQETRVEGRTLCKAEVKLPDPLIQHLGARAGALELRIGVHLHSAGGRVPVNLS